jgi:ribose transport system ATP-binding protein
MSDPAPHGGSPPAATAAASDLALDMRDIGMQFGEQWVLRNVDWAVHRGSVHALVGHNGAGKSTLMKIALGGYAPTEGTVAIGGVPLTFTQPAEARRLGVGMVFQERSLVSTLSGLDNIFLNAERLNRIGIVDRRKETAEARLLCAQLGISPSILNRQTSEMSQLQQELVEIAKAMRLARTVLILDEPTAPLTDREIAILFEVIRKAAKLGLGIVLITHHLAEVFAISDWVTTLREGSVTLSSPTAATNMSEVIEAMLGRRLMRVERTLAHAASEHRLPSERGATPVLEVEGLQLGDKLTAGVSFQLYPGEILGVTGLAGSGRTTLLRALYGDAWISAGSVRLRGRTYAPGSPADAIRNDIFLIPEDRGVHGLVLTAPIVDNTILPILDRLMRFIFLRISAGRDLARRMMRVLNIRSRGPQQIVGELSGGNQQKVVLAKALAADAELLLLDEPTFGVDIGAAADLIRHVREMTDAGKAALWVTSDLHELLEVADRVMVLADGGVHEIVKRGEPGFDEASLIGAMQRGGRRGVAAVPAAGRA